MRSPWIGASATDPATRARWFESCAADYAAAAHVRERELERRRFGYDLFEQVDSAELWVRGVSISRLEYEAGRCRHAVGHCRRWAAQLRLDAAARAP